ncbi:MAG: hypothetical protein WC655_19810 [Candidatus Hydrogenedentales bacterium]|jgi:hypothetical protein
MTYRGLIKNGHIILDESIVLPDGASVTVEVHDTAQSEKLHPDVIRFTGILPKNIDVLEEYRVGMERKYR